MKQIRAIFIHEWQQKRRSDLLILLFITMQILLLIALLTAWGQFKHTLNQQQSAQTIVEQQWQQQPERHPHRVAHFGHFTFRPPSSLSFFDNGVNHFVGNAIYIEAHKQNSANFANIQDSDVLLRFSELSVANILLLCWPLLLIALAYNSMVTERETGTLRPLLSMNIPLTRLLIGKGLAYFVVSILFIFPIFICTFGLITFSGLGFNVDTLLRILTLFVLYLAYCGFWIGLILVISSVVKYSSQALNILIAIWFLLTIISPRLLADIAGESYPQLNRNAFNQQIKQAINQVGDSHNPDDPHFNDFKTKVLAQYGVNHIEELPVNYRALVIQEGERISSEIYTRLYQQQVEQLRKQQSMLANWYWINPYLLVRDISMALSATDVWHFYDFEQQTEAHRFARISKLNKIHAEHIEREHDSSSKADSTHWQDFERFEYQVPSLSFSLAPFKQVWFMPLICFFLIGGLLFSKILRRRIYALA
ncbi:DUF3526 domain-containing protein [Thalassotalea sp. PP2-459]|uniref:ABC transporter permease n=1 Tax=Thalassotalea sp. PP2-459 TaxID=1742724 RepID=UPI00094286E1|nr:DUF3526 domain-containing protein [Thalassotalea sp. PP2-459]OKY25436.1 hypothetical protein BI291_16325 [Thalassotalea sp. PP2-459]